MAIAWPFKDPEEVLDYTITWTARLGDDVIVSSTFEIVEEDATLEIDSSSFTDEVTRVWLSGGTIGQKYNIVNHIVTDNDREMEQTGTLKIKAK